MAFPVLTPSSRALNLGDWPVRTFKSQNGAEVRILYGSKQSNYRLALSYNNVSDAKAEEFTLHYAETKGTFSTFVLSPAAKVALSGGWTGTINKVELPDGVDWRYEKAPQITAVRPGISTVSINLIGVI